MEFEELQQANTLIKTMPVKGKEYAEVNQRIKAFRYLYPNGAIDTEVLSHDTSGENAQIIMRAKIFDDEGKLLGSGTAYEVEGSSYINKTSYIENCETSAVGRALAMCGIGIDVSIASFEEVANAVEQQKSVEKINETDKKLLVKMFEENGQTEDDCIKWFKVNSLDDITAKQYGDFMHKVKNKNDKN